MILFLARLTTCLGLFCAMVCVLFPEFGDTNAKPDLKTSIAITKQAFWQHLEEGADPSEIRLMYEEADLIDRSIEMWMRVNYYAFHRSLEEAEDKTQCRSDFGQRLEQWVQSDRVIARLARQNAEYYYR